MPKSVSPSACKNQTIGSSPSTRIRQPAGITTSLNCMLGARLSLPSSPSADTPWRHRRLGRFAARVGARPAEGLPGRQAERFGMGPTVVLGQDLAEASGAVRDGAATDLAAGNRKLGDGHRETAGTGLAHYFYDARAERLTWRAPRGNAAALDREGSGIATLSRRPVMRRSHVISTRSQRQIRTAAGSDPG